MPLVWVLLSSSGFSLWNFRFGCLHIYLRFHWSLPSSFSCLWNCRDGFDINLLIICHAFCGVSGTGVTSVLFPYIILFMRNMGSYLVGHHWWLNYWWGWVQDFGWNFTDDCYVMPVLLVWFLIFILELSLVTSTFLIPFVILFVVPFIFLLVKLWGWAWNGFYAFT